MENTIINNQVAYTMPRIGDLAPAFTAETTQGPMHFPKDFEDKWVILFSHPADFTPVCSTEFMTFATMQQDFEVLNCQLIGLSVDSLYSHIAWLRTIQDKLHFRNMEHVEVRFPLIDDIRMEVAMKYGMIQPNESSTKAVRAVFFIDPRARIRAMIYYPLSTGRNFDELKRVLIALQAADAYGIATPADWKPGEDVIVPPPGSCGVAKDRMEGKQEGLYCQDWFFCMKPLKMDKIEALHIRKPEMHLN